MRVVRVTMTMSVVAGLERLSRFGFSLVFVGLSSRRFSSWNAKVEKRKEAEREKKKAAEFKHWQEV